MSRPRFTAEVSSNHNGDLGRALAFVDTAADIGCWGVKFQLFRIDKLFAPEILAISEEHRRRRKWELPLSFLAPIAERCKEKGIRFGCTPFYLEAVDELLPHVDFLKIASYELLWSDLLSKVNSTRKDVHFSVGMATLGEIAAAVALLTPNAEVSEHTETVLFHCVSGYPCPLRDCNLAAIDTLRSEFADAALAFGWSDHSRDSGVVHRAVHRWGAEVIEFHLDLDGQGDEYTFGHCWLPDEARTTIEQCRHGIAADGDGRKVPTPAELPDRDWRADPSDGLRPFLPLRQSWRPLRHE